MAEARAAPAPGGAVGPVREESPRGQPKLSLHVPTEKELVQEAEEVSKNLQVSPYPSFMAL